MAAACAALAGIQATAADGQWTKASKSPSAHTATTAAASDGGLKWRKRESIQPRRLDAHGDARPIAASRAGQAEIDRGVVFATVQPGDESNAIVLTKATGNGPDPFTDPFDDGKQQTSRPSKLRIFATAQDESSTDDEDLRVPADLPDDEAEQMPEPGQENILDEEIAQAPDPLKEPCPKPSDLKRINQITGYIKPSAGVLPQDCPLGDEVFSSRAWASTTYTWKASGLCHKPLYFEQVAVERYGHTWGPFLQPVASAAHFFTAVPSLPYRVGLELPWECVYPLGYYRPGSCAPYTVGPIPFSLRGAALQGSAVTGLIYAFP